LTDQSLTIIDNNNKSTEIKLDPSVRTYTDNTNYTGAMYVRGDHIAIFGRTYILQIKDRNLGTGYGGTDSGHANIKFQLKNYWGCSSKPVLSDTDINNMDSELIDLKEQSSLDGLTMIPYGGTKKSYENLYASGEYFYMIYPPILARLLLLGLKKENHLDRQVLMIGTL